MAAIIEEKDRRVIPNWRSFETTVSLGELNAISKRSYEVPTLSIDSYIRDYQNNKSIPYAADLLSASIVNGMDNENVKEAANFILEHQAGITISQKDLASKILFGPHLSENSIESITVKQLNDCFSKQDFISKIGNLKRHLIDYTYDPIAWVEISRCYSILGQEEKAKHAMKCAIQLAPDNRFVVRSAFRLFSHFNELDLAQYTLRHCQSLKKDPWLLSADVTLNTLNGKTSHLLKKGIELIDSNNFSPFATTELAASIATVQLLDGDRKKCRKMFAKSLVSPNDNSIAQVEWVLNNKDKTLFDKSTIDIKAQYNYEALAIDNFYNNNLIEALNNTCQWFCDMPFSKKPIIMGSCIADLLDNKNLAINFLEKGLISNSNDCQMLNNISYYHALENKIEQARNYIEKIDNKSVRDIDKICITATKGLICFRDNNFEEGRKLYLEAISKTTEIRSKELNYKAILNYTREELIAKSEYIETAMGFVSEMKDVNSMSIEIKKLHSEVITLYEKYKANMI